MNYDNYNYIAVKKQFFCIIHVFIYFDNAWDITCTFIGNIYSIHVIYNSKAFSLSFIYVQIFIPYSGPIVNINNSIYFLRNVTVRQFVCTNPYYLF